MKRRAKNSVPSTRGSGKRPGISKRGRGRESILKSLKPEEAASVLGRVLAAHPDLRAEAELHARSLLRGVTIEGIADEVETAVATRDLEDLNARAGRHAWGYVGPTEAAWEILEKAVEPFVAELKRRIALGLEEEAMKFCQGMVLGLYRAERAGRGDVLEWAADFPAESAASAIDVWRTTRQPAKAGKGGRLAFPRNFVDRYVPEWGDMLARHTSKEGKP